MRPPTLLVFALLSLFPAAASAQLNYEPTPPPLSSASDREWYVDADPIAFAGDLYYQTGPKVYFDGNTMRPTGTYDDVTLYTDATVEPYTLLLVPVGGKLLRPYERVREAYLPLRNGNRVNSPSTLYDPFYEAPAPLEEATPAAASSDDQADNPRRVPRGRVAPPQPRELPPPEEPQGDLLMETVRKPIDNLGIWVSFQGYRWTHAGEAIPLDPARLTTVGDYFGTRVYADPKTPYVIYIPLRAGVVAPFKREEGK